MKDKDFLKQILQELGAPCMDYSPVNANEERRKIISKTSKMILRRLRDER